MKFNGLGFPFARLMCRRSRINTLKVVHKSRKASLHLNLSIILSLSFVRCFPILVLNTILFFWRFPPMTRSLFLFIICSEGLIHSYVSRRRHWSSFPVSSSWAGRCRAARSSEGVITAVHAAAEGRQAAPGPTWHYGSEQFEDDRAPFFAIAIVSSCTNMHCTPTYANAQSEQALAQMLSCMIAHCDVGFGFTEAFREPAHTRMLHSVWFTMCVCL